MLSIVPTPIGNLDDFTDRSKVVLSTCDLILAEDTRTSGRLLKHFGIENQLQSFHAHNEHKKLSSIIDHLISGQHIALITDAGMPGISDPGYLLIREAIRREVEVDVLPGASAFLPGLLLSGFPNHIFQYVGFLPVKKGRKTMLDDIVAYPYTSVMYESPHRILKLVEQLCERCPDRWISISRELTKLHQTTIRGTVKEVLKMYEDGEKIKGEYVVTLAPQDFSLFD